MYKLAAKQLLRLTGQLIQKILIPQTQIHLEVLGFSIFLSIIFPKYALETMWWFFMGVLSSIGFGTGLHTGTIYLFPLILKTGQQYESMYNAWLSVLPRTIVWGIGTAFGELPPYLIAFYGKKNIKLPDKITPGFQKICWFMEWIIKKTGCLGVIGFSAWPNMFFDMCGMMCGVVKMPLDIFLVSTIIGKGFIKAPGQALFILWFGNKTSQAIDNNTLFYGWDLKSCVTPIWTCIVSMLIFFFVKSTIIELAEREKEYQAKLLKRLSDKIVKTK